MKVLFSDFNLDDTIIEGLKSMNFDSPTPIQAKSIPIIMEGRDIVACAQTGTGKTAAYLLPIVHRILQNKNRELNTLILAPTRELALQIDQQVEGFSYFCGISSIPVYGGGDGVTWDQQRKAMTEGAEIIIATPGRLIALLASGKIDLSSLQHLILDEADRMLDMGFHDDIVKIVKLLPAKRQTLLFSATMPPKIRKLAESILIDPAEVSISISKPAEGIAQSIYYIEEEYKTILVKDILTKYKDQIVIIFSSTKDGVKKTVGMLQRSGFHADAIHSDLEQAEREKIMNQFKAKQIKILVGTDIISRGIDVDGIDLVINMNTPSDPEDYIHRIGRTARAESLGTAITFVSTADKPKLKRIEQLIGYNILVNPIPEELRIPEKTFHPASKHPKGNFRTGGPGRNQGSTSKGKWGNKGNKGRSNKQGG